MGMMSGGAKDHATSLSVTAGLVPTIHELPSGAKDVDGWVKPGDDEAGHLSATL